MSRAVRTVATAGLAALAPAGVVLARLRTDGEVPDHVLPHARRAVAACPVLALRLEARTPTPR